MKKEMEALAEHFRRQLYQNTLPFWLEHGLDREHKGIFTGLGRRGELLESDKSVWFQGRAAWSFATAARFSDSEEERTPLIQAAEECVSFSDRYCWDRKDGRMYFRVSREGLPLIKRRYIFSECFAAGAKAALAAATGNRRLLDEGFQIMKDVIAFEADPSRHNPKVDPNNRPSAGLGLPMIMINILQELREAALQLDGESSQKIAYCTTEIEKRIDLIESLFVKPELKAVLEQTGPRGEYQKEHFEGRLVNPGHSIEAAWFILREAEWTSEAKRDRYIQLGCQIIDWMFDAGWDRKHGGFFYFLDAEGKPAYEYWHNMKFWWPHNEAVIASLYAALLSGEERYTERFLRVHHWIESHFPDQEHGEWYGYLNRDGTVSSPLKGSMFKGPFHIPRMQLWAWKLCQRLARKAY